MHHFKYIVRIYSKINNIQYFNVIECVQKVSFIDKTTFIEIRVLSKCKFYRNSSFIDKAEFYR